MRVAAYTHFGGVNAPLAQLANTYRALGITLPNSATPFSEALLLVIEGGLNFGTFLYEVDGVFTVRIASRQPGDTASAGPAERIGERLGIPSTRRETSGSKAAQRFLREALENERPAFVWADRAGLPHHHLPAAYERLESRICVALGFEDGHVLIDEGAETPWPVAWDVLNDARAAIGPLRNRVVTVGRPVAALKVKFAVEVGLREMLQNLFAPASPELGLPGLERWIERLRDPHHNKAWPNRYAKPQAAFLSLADTYDGIRYGHGAGGPGLLRELFGRGLLEAADLLNNPDLLEQVPAYIRLSQAWEEFAEHVLPETEGLLHAAKELLDARHAAFLGGPAGGPAHQTAQAEFHKLLKTAKKTFSNNERWLIAHYKDMANALEGLLEKEKTAAQAVANALN